MMTRAMFERLALALLILAFLFVGMGAGGLFRVKAEYQPSNDYFKVGPSSTITFINPYPRGDLKINMGKPGSYVTIKADGTIIYGDDYNPDVMAKAFWESLGERRNCK